MDPNITNGIVKALAVKVEWCAELYRQFGYQFPKDYEIALSIQDRWTKGGKRMLDLNLRVGDVREKVSIIPPMTASMDEIDRFRSKLDNAAIDMTTRYMNAHKEFLLDDTSLEEIHEKFRAAGEEGEVAMMEKAATAARTAKYTEVA